MKRIFLTICVTLISSMILCSCKSKEEKVIDQLNNLVENVEKNSSDWDLNQWEKAFEEMEKIHQEMGDCNFSNSQLQELGEVEGRLTSIMISKGAATLGTDLSSFLEGAASFVQGYQEGVEEGNEETIQQIESYIDQALNDLTGCDTDDE